MMARTLTRRQALVACGAMLAAGVLAPQMAAACGVGRLPDLSNVVVSPGESAAILSFDTTIARDAMLSIWSDDVPQSYQSFSRASVVMQHSFKVLGLQPNTRYHYEIRLHDTPDGSYIAYAADLRTRPFSGDAVPGAADADNSDDAADGA